MLLLSSNDLFLQNLTFVVFKRHFFWAPWVGWNDCVVIVTCPLCMLGKFSFFLLSSADFFSKLTFSRNNFRNIIGVTNCLDPDQNRHSIGRVLGPNCLQRVVASKERVIVIQEPTTRIFRVLVWFDFVDQP